MAFIMDGNTELLNELYQNAQMGVNTIGQLIDITDSTEFKQHLQAQYAEYREMCGEAEALLKRKGYDEKGIGTFAKVRTYLMINMQTLSDKSPSHIAEMLMVGSNMGIINAIKNLKKYEHADKESLKLLKRLLRFEENNVQRLKAFL